MSTETLIWVAVVIAAVAALVVVGYVVLQQQRRHRLRERFGPEYERTVRERDNRQEAEQELRARERRVAELDLRPLDPASREAYADKWQAVQERFVDAPGFAVTEADQLVTAVMAHRGYPTEGFEERLSLLSVEHGRTLDHYRRAHEISGRAVHRQASTEDLRQAMVHYRALFEELLADEGHRAGPAAHDEPASPPGPRTPADNAHCGSRGNVRNAHDDDHPRGHRREQYAGGRTGHDPRGR